MERKKDSTKSRPTVACQAPLFMGFSRQDYCLEWVAISFFQGNFPTPGIEPRSPALQADALPTELHRKADFGGDFKFTIGLPMRHLTKRRGTICYYLC